MEYSIFNSTSIPAMNLSTTSVTNTTFLHPITTDLINTNTKSNNTIPLPFNIVPLKIFLVVLYSLIFLVGVPGNILVISTIIRVPKMRSVKNLFIANLAICDLVSILWCLTNSLLGFFVSWPFGEGVCRYLFPIADVIIANTIFTMVLISIDRYRAIISPFSDKPTLRRTVLTIILFWIISYSTVGVPLIPATKLGRGFWVAKTCLLKWTSKTYAITYRLATLICVFLIPFAIVLFSFIRIKFRLEENIRFASTSMRGRSTLKRAKKNQRLIKMLFVIFLSFTICYLPVNILLMTAFFYPQLTGWKYMIILFQLAIAFVFLNSTMNPIILYLLSRDYRMGYLQQIKCLCPSNAKIQRAVAGLRRVSTSSFHLASFSLKKTSNDPHPKPPIAASISIEENETLLDFNDGNSLGETNLLSPTEDNNNGKKTLVSMKKVSFTELERNDSLTSYC